MEIYGFLDIFFVVFHLAVILFNLFGWIFRRTRKWNLALLVLTGFSWGFLGIFYGFGYCPLTDWHWAVLEKLGRYPVENSYTQYLFNRISGMYINSRVANSVTLMVYLAALTFSVFINIREYITRRKTERPN